MTARPSTEQLLIQVLTRSMVEVLRTFRLGDAEAPARTRAVEELELAFAPIWHRLPVLTLDVAPGSLRWDRHRVLEVEDDDQGLVSILGTAGIESLTFVPGVESGEAVRFLTAVDRSRVRSGDTGADLLTLLFQEDLHHLRYAVAPAVGESIPTIQIETVLLEDLEAAEAAVGVRDAVREDASREDRGKGVVRLEKFDSTLYFLDQREIEYLRTAFDREYAQDLASNALALLLDILQLRREPDVRREVIDILEDLMPYLLATGRFEAVAYLISEVRTVAREAADVTGEQKRALDSLRASVSDSHAIAQLFHSLEDRTVEPTQESLGILLRELRPRAIGEVLTWLDGLTVPEAKTALGEAVDAFFREWPTALARMLGASDQAVVHAALDLAARMKLPDFLDSVAELVDHDDPRTRIRVARTLAAIASGPALRSLVQMAEDPESRVRTVVFRTVAERRYRGGSQSLEQALTSGDLEGRGLREKRALFRAYGTVAGPAGVSKLEPLLRGKSAFARRPSSETRACAALALGIIGTPGARAALQQATTDRDPMVRSAAGSALRDEE